MKLNTFSLPAPLAAAITAAVVLSSPSPASAQDCNNNGIPDACDIDCGVPGGPCDVPGCSGSNDCNANGIPDECDAAASASSIAGTNRDFYLELNAITGAATAVSSVGLRGFLQVEGLAFDPITNTLFGTDTGINQLLTIDPVTGAGTTVGPLGFGGGGVGGVQGLAFVSNTNTLFGVSVDSSTGVSTLITIDPATGAGTIVGPIGFFDVLGLTFDPNTNTLLGTDIDTDQLITIDPAGTGTAVGSLGFSFVESLAFDPNTNTLFGVGALPPDQLLTIDPATGAGTAVGPTGFLAGILGLASILGAPSDCNGNSIPDECDITSGTSTYCNANGIPDECEPGVPLDITRFVGVLTGTNVDPVDACLADANGDTAADGRDIAPFVAALLGP
ncbi:MAG: hypothetical protein ACE5F9_13025 [Phycisphaerae bacterium]